MSSVSTVASDPSNEEIAYRTLANLTHDGLLQFDPETAQILYLNDAARLMFDLDDEPAPAPLSLQNICPPKSIPSLKKHIQNAPANRPVTVTCTLVRLSHRRFPAELVLQKIDFAPPRIACSIHDLSEKLRALEEINLRNSAIASLSSGVSIADARLPDLPLIYINEGFQKMTGYTAREAIGKSCRFLQADDRDQEELNILRNALKEGKSCVVHLRNYRKDGSLFHNELHLSPVYNNHQELTHFIGIQIDITEKFETQERLRQSELRYRELANAVTDLILRYDANSLKLEFASSAVKEFLGYSVEEMENRSLIDFIAPESWKKKSSLLQPFPSRKTSRTLSFKMIRKDGSPIWVESKDSLIPPSHNNGSPTVVSILRDVTLRKMNDEKIRRNLEKEKEINETKSRFISMVSHEFKTPITAINSSAQLIRDYYDVLTQEKRERHFANIERSLNRMNAMLNQVLFFSKAEANKFTVNPEWIIINELCENLIESLTLSYPGRTITFSPLQDSASQFFLDRNLIEHALLNLLSNALKYSKAPEPIELIADLTDNHLRITVQDHGIGIPPADQKMLFEAFHRAKNVSTITGTGLGLNIAKQAIDLLEGRLEFSSTEGKGSTFHLIIPKK